MESKKKKKPKTNKQTLQNPESDTENRLLPGRIMVGKSEVDEGGQKVQTSSYKINESWGWNVKHGEYDQ